MTLLIDKNYMQLYVYICTYVHFLGWGEIPQLFFVWLVLVLDSQKDL